jgi:SAM-dependent methyltransferase
MTSSELHDRRLVKPPSHGALPIALPEPGRAFAQDEEWCVARIDGRWRELRFHDYHRLYEIEGLYERVFYDVLKCQSPSVVRGLLETELRDAGTPAEELRVLDLGAGNGIMGEELVDLGVEVAVGVDIIPEAAEAAARDRPGVYCDYHVVDLTGLDGEDREALGEYRFNCLTCVAALGFGDIPPAAFAEAYGLVEPDGWVALTIKEEFLDGADGSGFSRLIDRTTADGALEVLAEHRYRHRLATNGDPLHYVAVVGAKRGEIDESLLA